MLNGADLSDADLGLVILRGVSAKTIKVGERYNSVKLENARALKGTILYRVGGLSEEQLEVCKAKGAIIDEDATTRPPQSPDSPSQPSQSNDVQAP